MRLESLYSFQLYMKIFCALLFVLTQLFCCASSYAQNGSEASTNYKTNTLIRFPTNAFKREFKDSLCLVSRGGKFGLVDSTGREVVPFIYDEINIDFSHREEIYYQLIYANELFYHYWQEGNESEEEYAKLLKIEKNNPNSCLNLFHKFKSDPLFPVKKDNKWGVINKRNEVIIPIQYDRIQEFGQDVFLVKNAGKSGVINSENNILVPLTCDTIMSAIICVDRMSDTDLKDPGSYALLKMDNKYGAINLFTQTTILPKYDSLELCYFVPEYDCLCAFNPHPNWQSYPPNNAHDHGNVITYKIDGKLGLLNIAKMTELTPPLYDSISFEGGFVGYGNIVRLDDKYTFLTDQNTGLHPHFYEHVDWFMADPIFAYSYRLPYNYFYKVKIDGKYKILHEFGEPMLTSRWDDVLSCIQVSDSFTFEFIVQRKGKLGVVNNADKFIVPIKYDSISYKYDNGHYYVLTRKNRLTKFYFK